MPQQVEEWEDKRVEKNAPVEVQESSHETREQKVEING